MKTTIGERLGTAAIDPGQTARFVKAWFHPDDLVLIVARPALGRPGRTLSMAATAREVAEWSEADLKAVGRHEDTPLSLYIGVSPLREDHQVTATSRGGKRDVREIYGVWADLDVKSGAFESREAIYAYLDGLELEPSITVENGSQGGVHAYWKLDQPVPATSDLPLRWWAYLDSKADGRAIDRLADSSRIMRLPGATYYPKDFGPTGPVKVSQITGAVYSKERIQVVSHEAAERATARREQTRAAHQMTEADMSRLMYAELTKGGDVSWTQHLARVALEERIQEMSWDDILIPAGWTHISDGEDGERRWARPGQRGKSAHTDWNGSEVMSLHSWSEETGLADLKEAGVPLTKPLVLLRVQYNGDVAAMINDLGETL